jgi:hypothetical protein
MLYPAELWAQFLAERLGLEPRTRLSPSDGLAIRSNTIMGSFHLLYGGSGEIRTHGQLSPPTVFKTVAINRTLPRFHYSFGVACWNRTNFSCSSDMRENHLHQSDLEYRVGFEPTALGICNPLRWTTPPSAQCYWSRMQESNLRHMLPKHA